MAATKPVRVSSRNHARLEEIRVALTREAGGDRVTLDGAMEHLLNHWLETSPGRAAEDARAAIKRAPGVTA